MSTSNRPDDESAVCRICNEETSKYCCPRCNILYCSIECYKSESHSQCSESFYRDCFVNELSTTDGDPRAKSKMLEILQKVHEADDMFDDDEEIQQNNEGLDDEVDSDDEESVPELADRLKDIDLNDGDAIWSLLTEDERREFESLVKTDIEKILPVWKPWWLYREKSKLISPVVENETIESDYKSACPEPLKNIKKIDQITNSKPSSCVKYNILNVLSSYCHTVKLFNGDHYELYDEAIACFILSSSNLNKNVNFDNVETAVESVVVESFSVEPFACSKDDGARLKFDMKCFARGPEESNRSYYALCALSDAIGLLSKFKSAPRKRTDEKSGSGFTRKFPNGGAGAANVPKDKIKLSIKKIEYYLSYVASGGEFDFEKDF